MAVADPGKEPVRIEVALDADLTRAEVDIYLTTAGMAERATELEERARAAELVSRVRRARLLRSDVLSRRGELEEALRLQIADPDRSRARRRPHGQRPGALRAREHL